MDAKEKAELRKVAADVLTTVGTKDSRLKPAVTKLAQMLTTTDVALHHAIMKVANVSLAEALRMSSYIAKKASEKKANAYCNPRMAGTKPTTPKVQKPKSYSGSPSSASSMFAKAIS